MRKTLNEMLIVSIFTAIMGQVHFYPFGTDFRITIGVILFTFLILYFYSLPIIATSLSTGLFVLLLRIGIDVFANLKSIDITFYKHFPAFIYYLSYGIIIDGLGFRKYTEKPVYFILIVGTADIFSNFFELIIRNQFHSKPFDAVLSTILLTAFLRSCTVFALFWVIKYYNLLISKEEHQRRYKDLLVLTARLKSEVFFLKKSMQDIENAMAKSYSIYSMIKECKYASQKDLEKIMADCLTLSIDIHEIKKDYNRIVMSMEKLMPTKDLYKAMKISEIFETIEDIFTRYLDVINKDIKLYFDIHKDFETKEYFIIISILNNLIQNSIEASTGIDSFVRVICFEKNSTVCFRVSDNGRGIDEKDKDLIFEPGYTTKYNPGTGQVSTGLGLTHIKILSEYLKGKINLNRTLEGFTEFILEFPSETIVYKGDLND